VVGKKEETQIIPVLLEDKRLAFLKPIVDAGKGIKKDFTTERKSAVYLREALERALRCAICGARLHHKSIHIDHIQRKADQGPASEDNAQLTHPYCNTSYKEKLVAKVKGAGVASLNPITLVPEKPGEPSE
jgi:hypothetical protein